MPTLTDSCDYSFEVSEEVKMKMEQAENLHTLISEDAVRDLKHIYITKSGYCKVKRLLDMILALLGLLVLLIPFAIIAAAIYLDDPGSILFTQYRVGRRGKRFKLFKFRTMKLETPKYLSTQELFDPDMYITRVGRFLRKNSLDELPQLINVVKGDMSLVGPRPLIADEYEIHAMRMRFGVYSVRPGVTGLAQIHGRDLVSPADKVRWDVKYLHDFGFCQDFMIILQTIPKVMHSAGVQEGHSDEKDDQHSVN